MVQEHRRRRRLRLKQEAMEAYGGKCTCCGVGELIWLTIDHVDGNGKEHRRSIGASNGQMVYIWLKKSGYPPGFQVLCFNCNFAKQWGGCPHESRS